MTKLEPELKERLINEFRRSNTYINTHGYLVGMREFPNQPAVKIYDYLGVIAKMFGHDLEPNKYTRLSKELTPNVPDVFLDYRKNGLGYKFEKFYSKRQNSSWLIGYIKRYL